MGNGEVHESAALHLTHHVKACIGLPVGVLVLEVAVQIHASRAVFVDKSVPVLVGPFPVEGEGPRLALCGVGPLHEPFVVRVDHVGTGRIGYPHDGDVPVSIQVLRSILVDAAVVVVVEGPGVRLPVPLDPGEHGFRAIGIEPWEEVEHMVIEGSLDGLLLGVRDQVADRLEGQLASHQVVTLQVAHHQDSGPLRQWDTGGVPDRHHPDLPALKGGAEGLHGGEVRAVDDGTELTGESVMIQVGGCLSLAGSRRQQNQSQKNRQPRRDR